MTKKDYIIIARAIREAMALRDEALSLHPQTMAIKTVCYTLIKEMQKDNPRFEASKFLAACEIELNWIGI
jgi:hypothetical protein